jgi:serine/threonine protein kinase
MLSFLLQVFLAIDNETGREWAVKFINIRNAAITSKLTLASILKEAEIMKNLSHPYIVNLEDVFMDETNVYLVMELLSGDPDLEIYRHLNFVV